MGSQEHKKSSTSTLAVLSSLLSSSTLVQLSTLYTTIWQSASLSGTDSSL